MKHRWGQSSGNPPVIFENIRLIFPSAAKKFASNRPVRITGDPAAVFPPAAERAGFLRGRWRGTCRGCARDEY
jgi:hypothetical protein